MSPKKLTATERNVEAYRIVTAFLKNKRPGEFSTPFIAEEVESLFQTPIWGHREIILTIIVASLLDPKFKASKDFYACNPRSIFEQPIRKALREFGIPHRKSGPLNVAKNSKKINSDWATDKHGGEIAMNVVKIVRKIESVNTEKLKQFAQAYIYRYKQEAKRIKELGVELPPQENPIFLSKLCFGLINEVPDGGATPQFIVGLLMESMNKDRKNAVSVFGHKDSVSTTNTTSKKPGDIVETISEGSELIYEITVKKFSDDRLIESHDAVLQYSPHIKDVYVVCRPEDVPDTLSKEEGLVIATTQYRELSYYFLNIYYFIQSKVILLSPEGRRGFYQQLVDYINDTNTSEKVKVYFSRWHTENGTS